MTTVTTSSNAIINVNNALYAELNKYLNPNSVEGIDIRFDLPEMNSSQSSPTVSVFLYDVHEDMQLRQSEQVRFNIGSSSLRPGWVNLNCNYLVTYWEAHASGSDGNSPDSTPDNQAVKVMTKILQALLNNRELTGLPGAYTRVIPPQENLNSLGNFWQALGNRPRLSLMYSVTVPIMLDNRLPQTLVKTVSSEIMQTAVLEGDVLDHRLWEILCQNVGVEAKQMLARVIVKAQRIIVADENALDVNFNLKVSGFTDKTCQEKLISALELLENEKDAVTTINGANIYIHDIEYDGVIFV